MVAEKKEAMMLELIDKKLFQIPQSSFISFFFFQFFGCAMWHVGIIVPQPGIEPMPPAVEAWSLNHWTAREVPKFFYFLIPFNSIQ